MMNSCSVKCLWRKLFVSFWVGDGERKKRGKWKWLPSLIISRPPTLWLHSQAIYQMTCLNFCPHQSACASARWKRIREHLSRVKSLLEFNFPTGKLFDGEACHNFIIGLRVENCESVSQSTFQFKFTIATDYPGGMRDSELPVKLPLGLLCFQSKWYQTDCSWRNLRVIYQLLYWRIRSQFMGYFEDTFTQRHGILREDTLRLWDFVQLLQCYWMFGSAT